MMANAVIVRVLFVVGLATTAVGVALAVTGTPLPLGEDGDSTFVLLGLLALLQALRSVWDYRMTTRQSVKLPPVEGNRSGVVPGDQFEMALDRSSRRDQRGTRNRRSIRRHLRQTAERTLVARTAASAEEARRKIEEGSWTEDPMAAALFATDTPPTWRDRVRVTLGRETTFQRQVRRAVSALEGIGDNDG
ncbi:MAG: hypothetical protein V5A45_11935 [Haloarculaceae archaeon]